jgi:hypothetical protein
MHRLSASLLKRAPCRRTTPQHPDAEIRVQQLNPIFAARIRAHGGLPHRLEFPPPEPAIVEF